MRHDLLTGMLGLLCLTSLSCTPETHPDDPFAGAKWIGTSENVLYADFLPQFILSADIDIAPGSSRASVLLGGNDPRLMDADLNILGVENGPDESFVRVELDREKKCVNVYRTGYTKADVPGKVLQSLAVDDSLLTDGPARLTAEVAYNQLRVLLGDVSLGRVNVGPLGRSGDYIAYPQLADVGWLVEEGQTARVSHLEVREIRGPHALLYRNDGMAAPASGVKVLCEPSHGGMPILRSSFKLKKKEIESATLYATARGIYEVSLNGEKVGADFLAPGLSQYNKHHYYQCYDVTGQLAKGKNEILVSLGEGWWSGEITFGNGNRNYFGDQLAFLASLQVKYTDGSTQSVVTDPSTWRVTTDGPVVYASLFQGQVTDAQRSLADATWHPAEEMVLEGHISDATFGQTAPRTDEYDNWELVPQEDPSPRVFTTLAAEGVAEVRPGVFVYDMGQNFAGIPSVTLRGLKK